MAKKVSLVAPSGKKYETTDAAEVVRLKARGYREEPKKQAPKQDSK